MNQTKKQIMQSMFSVVEVLNDTDSEKSVLLLCDDTETVFLAEFTKFDEFVGYEIALKVKAEDATAFEDVMDANFIYLTNPAVDVETWSDVHELWIQFNFVWADDELLFQEVVSGLLH